MKRHKKTVYNKATFHNPDKSVEMTFKGKTTRELLANIREAFSPCDCSFVSFILSYIHMGENGGLVFYKR